MVKRLEILLAKNDSIVYHNNTGCERMFAREGINKMMVATIEWNKQEALESLNLNESNYRLMDVLIRDDRDWAEFLKVAYKKSENTFEDFINNWNNNKERQTFAVAEYREYKIDNYTRSFEGFMKQFMKDRVTALQNLFFEDVIEEDTERVMKWLKKETLKDLYEARMKKPYKTLLSHLL